MLKAILVAAISIAADSSALTFEQIKANLVQASRLDTLEALVDIQVTAAAFSTQTSTHLFSAGREKFWMETSLPGGRKQRVVRNGNRFSATNPLTGREESMATPDLNFKNPLDYAAAVFDGGRLVSLTEADGDYLVALEYGGESPVVRQTFRYDDAANRIVGIESVQKDGSPATTRIEYCEGCERRYPRKIEVLSGHAGNQVKVVLDFKVVRALGDVPENLFLIK